MLIGQMYEWQAELKRQCDDAEIYLQIRKKKHRYLLQANESNPENFVWTTMTTTTTMAMAITVCLMMAFEVVNADDVCW